MKTPAVLVGICLCVPLAAGGARGPDDTPAEPIPVSPAAAGPKPITPTVSPADRNRMLLDIARKFSSYRLASPWPEWALVMCRVVDPGEVTGVLSRSEDERTHGTKLYKLWVSDYESYMRLAGYEPSQSMLPPATKATTPLMTAPIGLTLVKETFAAVQVSKKEEPTPNPYRRDLIVDGDHAYRQGAPGELFIMTKLDPKTPDTDLGWVYAVVSADRKTVLQSGRIENCMHCHERTTRDRLYGPESTWPKDKDGKAMLPIRRSIGSRDASEQKPVEPNKDTPPTPIPTVPPAHP